MSAGINQTSDSESAEIVTEDTVEELIIDTPQVEGGASL